MQRSLPPGNKDHSAAAKRPRKEKQICTRNQHFLITVAQQPEPRRQSQLHTDVVSYQSIIAKMEDLTVADRWKN